MVALILWSPKGLPRLVQACPGLFRDIFTLLGRNMQPVYEIIPNSKWKIPNGKFVNA